ncbi:hypothetical protein D3C81_2238100 [compost metagenome]
MRQPDARSGYAFLVELGREARLKKQLPVAFLNPASVVSHSEHRMSVLLMHLQEHPAFTLNHLNSICRKITEQS